MKRLILILIFVLISGSCFAGDVYISDVTDPSEDGTESHPFDTFSDITWGGISAGDTIYLKRGSAWTEQMTIGASGSSGSPITITAYGSGDIPHITGSNRCIYALTKSYINISYIEMTTVDVNNEAALYLYGDCNYWTISNCIVNGPATTVNTTRNVWLRSAAGLHPDNIIISDCTITDPNVYGLQAEACNNCTVLNVTITGQLYATGAAFRFADELSQGSDNLTMSNCTATTSGGDGFQFYGSTGLTVTSLTATSSSDNAYHFDDWTTATVNSSVANIFTSDGFNITGTSNGLAFINCSAYGGSTADNSTGFTTTETANTVTYNRCKSYNNAHDGISGHDSNSAINVYNCLIYNNNDGGIVFAGTDSGSVYGNTIFSNGDSSGDRAGIRITTEGAFTIKNNILYGNYPREISIEHEQIFTDGTTLDYNCYFHTAATRSDVTIDPDNMGLDVSTSRSCSAWLSNVSEEGGNSICDNPLLTSTYKIPKTSPAYQAGTYITGFHNTIYGQNDYFGNPFNPKGPVNIGCYQQAINTNRGLHYR